MHVEWKKKIFRVHSRRNKSIKLKKICDLVNTYFLTIFSTRRIVLPSIKEVSEQDFVEMTGGHRDTIQKFHYAV